MHPVSTDVNNVRNKGRELTDPIDPDAAAPGAQRHVGVTGGP